MEIRLGPKHSLVFWTDGKHRLLFAYSGFLRGLRYKKSRDGTLRDPTANAQVSEIMGRRNGIVGGNTGNTENQWAAVEGAETFHFRLMESAVLESVWISDRSPIYVLCHATIITYGMKILAAGVVMLAGGAPPWSFIAKLWRWRLRRHKVIFSQRILYTYPHDQYYSHRIRKQISALR